MNAEVLNLPVLVRRAADQLASATSAAEVLDARDRASVVYDMAKKAARLAKAKAAHDEIIVKAAHAQADALEIESVAKRRLADEYDAAQERGEISQQGAHFSDGKLRSGEIFPRPKELYDARTIRDAEEADPGIVRRSLDARLANGEEPTRAALRRDLEKPAPPKARVSDDALWLWGRLRDFERLGYFEKKPRALLGDMTEPMRADVSNALPDVIAFLKTMEDACNDYS